LLKTIVTNSVHPAGSPDDADRRLWLGALLADPRSRRSEQPEAARNALRSTRPDLAVIEAVCTHLGCVPSFRPIPGSPDIGAQWPGGFHWPCHGSKFDLAGRVFKNVPAPTNLTVPPHRFLSEAALLIGADPGI
jgi:ubiquinol-cytochrome c reductase iron-sulfur subunit